MLALAVWLQVAAVYTEDIAVDELDLTETMAEDLRLSTPPPLEPFGIMFGLGVLALPGGVVSTYFANEQWQKSQRMMTLFSGFDRLFWGSFTVVTGFIAVVGLALAVTGGMLMYMTARRRDDLAVRHAAVRERLAKARFSDGVDQPKLDALEREVLAAQRPGMGLPAGLLGGGIAALAAGALTMLMGQAGLVAGTVELAIGSAMIGVSIWQFIARANERDRLDTRLPPPQWHETRLPPAPAFIALGGAL